MNKPSRGIVHFSVFLLFRGTGLGALRTILGTGLATVGNTLGIERTADDVVTHAREVLNTGPATNQYDAVLLQVVGRYPECTK